MELAGQREGRETDVEIDRRSDRFKRVEERRSPHDDQGGEGENTVRKSCTRTRLPHHTEATLGATPPHVTLVSHLC